MLRASRKWRSGIFVTDRCLLFRGKPCAFGVAPLATLGLRGVERGLACAVFHLGRPLGAWRFFLGLRTSWMSREILAFGVFARTAAFLATAVAAGWLPDVDGLRDLSG